MEQRYLIALGSNRRHVRHGAPERVLAAALRALDRGKLNLMLAALKAIERQFGRRRGGQRWAARVLDLDIVLWSGGPWASPSLTVPHPEFRRRGFVLGPARAVAPDWRDPVTRLTLRQLYARLLRSAPRGA